MLHEEMKVEFAYYSCIVLLRLPNMIAPYRVISKIIPLQRRNSK